MTATDIDSLNRQFGQPDALHFSIGKGGLAKLDMRYGTAQLEVYLQGAHISRYQPAPGFDLLWLSETAVYQSGRALRGGIPLCWPWFGVDTNHPARAQHGFARTREFSVVSVAVKTESVSITLALDTAAAPYPDWEHRARLEFEIRLADSLWMEMRSDNLGQAPFILSQALHSYFTVSARSNISIPAVGGLTYQDKLLDYREQQQHSALVLDAEVDRVYRDPPATIELLDAGRQGSTSIDCWGNSNLVIWNPGPQKSIAMQDFDDDGYDHMVCIEPANALAQSILLQPGEQQSLGQKIIPAKFSAP